LDVDSTDRITCETLGFGGEANAMDPCGGAPVNDAASCGAVNGYWLTASGTCYTSAQERCDDAHGTLDTNTNICKFLDPGEEIQNKILDNDMACYSGRDGSDKHSSCLYATINEGGVCHGDHLRACMYAIVNNGGVCDSKGQGGCNNATVNDGGVCLADNINGNNGCNHTILNTGGICDGIAQNTCYHATINEGGVCLGKNTNYAGYTCKEAIVNKGGICIGAGNHACRQAIVESGGIVVAQDSTTGYGNTYKGTGCCVDCTKTGFCHDSGHVCQLSSEDEKRYCDMYKENQ
jgi:hypothetical protein